MNYLSELKDKNILILGAGLTGLSCARFLHHHNIAFSINDSREHALKAVEDQAFISQNHSAVGKWDQQLISKAEVLLASPGIDLSTPEIASAISASCEVFGDVELYCRVTDTPIIAVTGSNGKSTVVSLLEHVGKSLGKHVALGGNVGVPVLDRLIQNEPIELLIAELSSFQLETLTSMKAISVSVLNVSDDHLDRHKTIENYAAIKQRIYQQCQTAVVNRGDELTQVPEDTCANVAQVSFGTDAPTVGNFGIVIEKGDTNVQQSYLAKGVDGQAFDLLAPVNNLPLAGLHNAMNYLVVCALAETVNWPLDKVIESFSHFDGLAHRCQRIATNDDIVWINDSKATNVGATKAALDGLLPTLSNEQNLILIAGGDGKGADFSPLSDLLSQSVKQVITLGKDGKQLGEIASKTTHVSNLAEAVTLAAQSANSGDIVLLSPACASIDMFRNFVERGEQFIAAVQSISPDNREAS